MKRPAANTSRGLIQIKVAPGPLRDGADMEAAPFALASLTLLATPGPTNTLLATSGAAVGARRSLMLLLAELSGYVLAIMALRVVIGPVIAAAPIFGSVLRLLAAGYLLTVAARLWRTGLGSHVSSSAVTFGRVFATTLLNPKAIIFAFTLLPAEIGAVALLPWISALALMIFAVGGGWIALGASLRKGFGDALPLQLVFRTSAIAVALLAVGITVHALQVA